MSSYYRKDIVKLRENSMYSCHLTLFDVDVGLAPELTRAKFMFELTDAKEHAGTKMTFTTAVAGRVEMLSLSVTMYHGQMKTVLKLKYNINPYVSPIVYVVNGPKKSSNWTKENHDSLTFKTSLYTLVFSLKL